MGVCLVRNQRVPPNFFLQKPQTFCTKIEHFCIYSSVRSSFKTAHVCFISARAAGLGSTRINVIKFAVGVFYGVCVGSLGTDSTLYYLSVPWYSNSIRWKNSCGTESLPYLLLLYSLFTLLAVRLWFVLMHTCRNLLYCWEGVCHFVFSYQFPSCLLHVAHAC